MIAAVWISAWFSFSNGRVQIIGVLVNSLLTLGLLIVYLSIAEKTATQADLQETQTKLMELQAKPILDFGQQDIDGSDVYYTVENEGDGIALDIAIEVRCDGTSFKSLAQSVNSNPKSSPSVLRPGDSKRVKFPLKASTEGSEAVPVDELHEKLKEHGEPMEAQIRFNTTMGSGRVVSHPVAVYKIGEGDSPIEQGFRPHLQFDPS
jgi:hypothetical protein